MKKTIITISITAAVVIIVLAGVLMPVLDDATATEDTFKNEGYFFVKEYTDGDTYTATWDHTNPNVFTINGEDVALDMDLGNISLVSIFAGEDFLIRWDSYNKALVCHYGNNPQLVAGVSEGWDLNITYSSGTLTVSNTASTPVTRSITTDSFYSIASAGDLVMKKSNEAAYVNSDSQIIGAGRTNFSNSIICTTVSGTIENMTADIWRGDATASDVIVTATAVNSHVDLFKFDNVKFTATSTLDSSITQTVTYSYVIVPYEVTAERAEHFTTGQIAIFGAIPVMIIAALLVGVVALVIRTRAD